MGVWISIHFRNHGIGLKKCTHVLHPCEEKFWTSINGAMTETLLRFPVEADGGGQLM